MIKKTILATLAVCTLGVCRPLWAVDIENASSGAVVPGEWNTSFTATKAYAEQNNMLQYSNFCQLAEREEDRSSHFRGRFIVEAVCSKRQLEIPVHAPLLAGRQC